MYSTPALVSMGKSRAEKSSLLKLAGGKVTPNSSGVFGIVMMILPMSILSSSLGHLLRGYVQVDQQVGGITLHLVQVEVTIDLYVQEVLGIVYLRFHASGRDPRLIFVQGVHDVALKVSDGVQGHA